MYLIPTQPDVTLIERNIKYLHPEPHPSPAFTTSISVSSFDTPNSATTQLDAEILPTTTPMEKSNTSPSTIVLPTKQPWRVLGGKDAWRSLLTFTLSHLHSYLQLRLFPPERYSGCSSGGMKEKEKENHYSHTYFYH